MTWAGRGDRRWLCTTCAAGFWIEEMPFGEASRCPVCLLRFRHSIDTQTARQPVRMSVTGGDLAEHGVAR